MGFVPGRTQQLSPTAASPERYRPFYMRLQLLSCFFGLSLIVSAQHSQQIDTKVVKFRTVKGDSIKVTARPLKHHGDTAELIIESIVNMRSKEIQRLTTSYSFPLNISLVVFNGSQGITVQYDPAARYRNSFLYLFDERVAKLKKVINFEHLGDIQSFTENNKTYSYSYISCGCADNCWKSVLFEIKNFQIDTLGFLHCDCSTLTEKTLNQKEVITKTCDEFNNPQKFSVIKKYWANRTKNGL